MKNCATCPKLIKNDFTHCYECNNKDDSSETEVVVKRESIPKCVRNAVWRHQNDNKLEAKCICCLVETVTIGNFHAGHIQALINNGSTSLENLVPICMLCNTSMGRYNLNKFIQKYNLH